MKIKIGILFCALAFLVCCMFNKPDIVYGRAGWRDMQMQFLADVDQTDTPSDGETPVWNDTLGLFEFSVSGEVGGSGSANATARWINTTDINASSLMTDNGTVVDINNLSINASYTFPTADGNASEFLQTNGNRTVRWAVGGGVNETYGSGWNGDTNAPEKDDIYDYLHQIDSNDDGDVDNIDATYLATVETDPNVDTADEIEAILLNDNCDFGTGNLGTDALDVSDGNITSVGDIALDSISSTAGTSISVTLGSDAGDDLLIDSTGLVYEGDGNQVGIGTASPSEALEVVGKIKTNNTITTTAATGFISGDGTAQNITLLTADIDTTDPTIIWDDANDEFDFNFPINIGGTSNIITFGNSETIDNANDDYIEFQGGTGGDDTDLRIDLDGTHPVIESPTDSRVQVTEEFQATDFYSGDGTQGATTTISVRKGDDSGACTITVKDGLITGDDC